MLLVLQAAAASAQVGGSITLESDYRFRGISLNRERPDLRLSLAFDHPNGSYTGLSLTGVAFDAAPRRASVLLYAGRAGAAGESLRWDLGATSTHVLGDTRYNNLEAFAGLLGENWSLRLSVAPNYFGSGRRIAYAEVDAGRAIAPAWRLIAHVGVLRALDGDAGSRLDTRLGVVLHWAELDLQLAWVGVQRGRLSGAPYGADAADETPRSSAVFGISYAF